MEQSDKLPTIPEQPESAENILEHSTDMNQPVPVINQHDDR